MRRPGPLQAGFAVIEALIAGAVLAIALTAIISSQIELGEINARAEVQSVAASAAEAAAAQYALSPPAAGSTVEGVVGTDLNVPGLTAEQREIADRLTYQLTGLSSGAIRIRVARNDLPTDPYALELTTIP